MPKESAVITNHVTMHFGDLTTECVVNVPIGAGNDHRKMPLVLRKMQKTTCPSNKNAAKNRNYAGRLGRLDIDGAFAACLTNIHPLNMNGKVCFLQNTKPVFHFTSWHLKLTKLSSRFYIHTSTASSQSANTCVHKAFQTPSTSILKTKKTFPNSLSEVLGIQFLSLWLQLLVMDSSNP
jgi:hypothetical protein